MIDLVRIEKPAISLLKHAIPEDTMATPFQFDPYRLIAPALNALRIKQVRIGDGKLSFREQGHGDELELQFDRFNLAADELYIDSLSSQDTPNAFYTDNLDRKSVVEGKRV